MILNILKYPNQKLYQKSEEVTNFDDKLGKFLDDMYETMIDGNGIGLAAIQVGEPIRALVINMINEDEIQDKEDLLEIINPKIIDKKGEVVFQEGCLSVPDFFEDVKRAKFIKLEYQDRFGNKQSLESDDLLAVAIQHECDHLDGHLFIEKLNFTQRKKFDKEFKKKKKNKK